MLSAPNLGKIDGYPRAILSDSLRPHPWNALDPWRERRSLPERSELIEGNTDPHFIPPDDPAVLARSVGLHRKREAFGDANRFGYVEHCPRGATLVNGFENTQRQ
jgi:hypothetical protein